MKETKKLLWFQSIRVWHKDFSSCSSSFSQLYSPSFFIFPVVDFFKRLFPATLSTSSRHHHLCLSYKAPIVLVTFSFCFYISVSQQSSVHVLTSLLTTVLTPQHLFKYFISTTLFSYCDQVFWSVWHTNLKRCMVFVFPAICFVLDACFWLSHSMFCFVFYVAFLLDDETDNKTK